LEEFAGDELLQVVKAYIKEEKKPYIPFGDLLRGIGQKHPGTEESKVNELIRILKNREEQDSHVLDCCFQCGLLIFI
jgi:hypothetical protein